jgi:hypothetical protein
MPTTDDTIARQDLTDGLRALADFLDAHDQLAVPTFVTMPCLLNQQDLAAWIDGLDHLDVTDSYSGEMRRVTRSFLGLEVSALTFAEFLGTKVTHEVTTTVAELHLFTIAEIEAMARGDEPVPPYRPETIAADQVTT